MQAQLLTLAELGHCCHGALRLFKTRGGANERHVKLPYVFFRPGKKVRGQSGSPWADQVRGQTVEGARTAKDVKEAVKRRRLFLSRGRRTADG
jgi:hypothetical protein